MNRSREAVRHDVLVRSMCIETLVACVLVILWADWTGAQWVSVLLSDDAYYFFEREGLSDFITFRPLSAIQLDTEFHGERFDAVVATLVFSELSEDGQKSFSSDGAREKVSVHHLSAARQAEFHTFTRPPRPLNYKAKGKR